MNIKNRIINYGFKKADQFTANPLNWRKHPIEQRTVVRESLNELGWIGVVVENVGTGNLIDGHERVMQALENNEDVPFIQVDLTEEEEKLALAIFDPITNMAVKDDEIYQQLVEFLNVDNKVLNDLINNVKFDYSIMGKMFLPEAGQGEKEVDENIETENVCPQCGYKW